ncbi:hypothetical protein H0H87_008573 [Tephrocybe sp. NHM501043]|nr:hypothetical protein H0H87_008573 [Tephrocybe sp. NHM501043]
MQRSELILGALRGISAFVGDRFLTPTHLSDPSHAYVEFRAHRRTCEVWQEEVLDVFLQSQPGDYGSARSRILNERVVEIRAYKLRASDDVYKYLVAAVSTQESLGHHVYMRLELGLTYPAVVERLDSWPKDSNLLLEQTCFTDSQPVLLDLILLAPIVARLKPIHYEYKCCEFFFADLILRTFQELFRYTSPLSDVKYMNPTFVIVELSREEVKQTPRCFVVPFRSKMLDEIEPQFIESRRSFGLKAESRSNPRLKGRVARAAAEQLEKEKEEQLVETEREAEMNSGVDKIMAKFTDHQQTRARG